MMFDVIASPSPSASPAAFCFSAEGRRAPVPAAPVTLDDPARQALAMLLPLLGCGEEAAALAFDGIAARLGDPAATGALDVIAREEEVHDALLRGLAETLGPTPANPALRRARRMHVLLGRGGPALHLGRIAALDAGLCTVLSRLLAPGRPLARDPVVAPLLARIRRDETRHVRLSRGLASDRESAATLRGVAAESRALFASVLELGGDWFEALEVDADMLVSDVRRLPTGLFA